MKALIINSNSRVKIKRGAKVSVKVQPDIPATPIDVPMTNVVFTNESTSNSLPVSLFNVFNNI